MIIQTVFLNTDGSRVLWDTDSQCYLVKSETPPPHNQMELKERFNDTLENKQLCCSSV